MSNATRQGSPDERYALPVEASRRGAHRARPNPFLGVLPLVGVGVVVIAVAALAYWLFGSNGGTDSSTTALGSPTAVATGAAQAGQPGQSVQASAPAGGEVSPSAVSAGSPSVAAGGASPNSTGTATGTGTGQVNHALTLNFYNGSNPVVPGLSRKAAAKFPTKKWKIGAIQSWTGTPVTQTTVFYAKPEQQATAQAVVDLLGVGTVAESAEKTSKGLAVVISNDFQP